MAFSRLLLLYAKQYDPATASNDPGIPLRLNADINETSTRAGLQQSYDQVLSDLGEALDLLPANTPTTIINKTKPSKVAAHGLLARVYLQMGNYSKAKEHADAALQMHGSLLDFNDANWVTPAGSPSIKPFNPEMILYLRSDAGLASNAAAKTDTVLYASYTDPNDLRKTVYFNQNPDGSYRFKGSYCNNLLELFCGIATDELMLIRAECFAREGQTASAMKDLNDLLRTRWKKIANVTTYVDQTAASSNEALVKIIAERKRELVNRELRWADLKRLNKEPAFATTLTRTLNNQVYTLPPNDLRYVLLIPQEVLRIVNLPQNPR
jgi:tetratricopeptide (TPR) repeat protein